MAVSFFLAARIARTPQAMTTRPNSSCCFARPWLGAQWSRKTGSMGHVSQHGHFLFDVVFWSPVFCGVHLKACENRVRLLSFCLKSFRFCHKVCSADLSELLDFHRIFVFHESFFLESSRVTAAACGGVFGDSRMKGSPEMSDGGNPQPS